MFKRYDPDGGSRPADHPVPILTMGVITICCVVFLSINLQGASEAALHRWGYVPPEEIWSGAYRGIISSAFVHVAPLHLIFNLYWLWILGSAIELEVGPARWLALFLTSAAVSSGLQLATGDGGIGMSGVNYAFFGFAWASRWQIDRFRSILSRETAMLMIIWLVGCWIATLGGYMNIANEAHLAGLVFGTLVAEVFVRKRRRVVLASALAVVTVVCLVPVFWAPWTREWAAMQAYRALGPEAAPAAEEAR